MRRSVAKAAVAVLCAALALPVSPASADSSTAILINNVLHSISVLQPTQPTDPSRVIGIGGLNSLEGPRLSRRSSGTQAPKPAALGPSTDTGLTSPSDLWSIYDQPSNNLGEGQQMAIFGWGTTKNTLSDLRQFEAENKLPAMPVSISYYGTESA